MNKKRAQLSFPFQLIIIVMLFFSFFFCEGEGGGGRTSLLRNKKKQKVYSVTLLFSNRYHRHQRSKRGALEEK